MAPNGNSQWGRSDRTVGLRRQRWSDAIALHCTDECSLNTALSGER